MIGDSSKDITQLLAAWNQGDRTALDRLVPLVETQLRKIARHALRRERADHPLQTTELLNEVFLRLIGEDGTSWQNRAHFYGITASIMRRILVDQARKRRAAKRGGDRRELPLDDGKVCIHAGNLGIPDMVAIHNALRKLERLDRKQGRIVELRVFGGLSIREVAEVMRCSVSTIKREWATAKAWLYQKLTEGAVE